MQVADAMSTPAVTVSPERTLYEAIEVMLKNRVGSAIVAETGIVGIITRSDILRAAYVAGEALDDIAVTRGMSGDVVTTTPSASIRTALALMDEHDIKKLPVVEDLELVGVITATDIARHQPERVQEIRETSDRRDVWTD